MDTSNARNLVDDIDRGLPWTGERYIPGIGGLICAEHLHRYFFARELVSGCVIDVACGEGYGSDLLADSADMVVGVDVNEAAVRHARRKYSRGNLHFLGSDCCRLPFDSATFDWAISFETIEHIADPKGFLSEVKRILKPSGHLLISSPNRRSSSGEVGNKFHQREFSAEEFSDLLSLNFDHTRYWDQASVMGSAILSRSASLYRPPHFFYKSSSRVDETASIPWIYSLALAGSAEPPTIGESLFSDPELLSENHVKWIPSGQKVSLLRVGRTLDFSAGGDGDLVTYVGFGDPEPGGTWTVARDCLLRFRILQTSASGISLRLYYHSPHNIYFEAQFKVNGRTLEPRQVGNSCALFEIPSVTLNVDGLVEFEICIENAMSPFDRGTSEDPRRLGINFRSLEILEGTT